MKSFLIRSPLSEGKMEPLIHKSSKAKEEYKKKCTLFFTSAFLSGHKKRTQQYINIDGYSSFNVQKRLIYTL